MAGQEFTVKLGMSYLYGSLVPQSTGNKISFDRPVKKLRAPMGIGLDYDNEGTDLTFVWIPEGGTLEFSNQGGYPQEFSITCPDNLLDGSKLVLDVVEYGDQANEHYFDPVEPEQPEP